MHTRRLAELTACLAGGLILILILAPQSSAHTSREPLVFNDDVEIRKGADGGGPSHLIAIGEHLLVVDPRERQIIRYQKADLKAPPVRCTFRQSPDEWPRFSPWRTVQAEGAVHLVAEPYGPSAGADYNFVPRRTMVIDQAHVTSMVDGAPCEFAVRNYSSQLDGPLRFGWSAGEKPGSTALVTLRSGKIATITPRGGKRAEVFAVRLAGQLAEGRQLLWWSELDGYPVARPGVGATADEPGKGGRVTSSQYVGVFSAAGGDPIKVVRIENASYAPLSTDGTFPDMDGVDKLGFEYAIGGTVDGKDVLWVAASRMDAEAEYKPFHLRRYPLDGTATELSVVLTEKGSVSGDRNDGRPPAEEEGSTPRFAQSKARGAWFNGVPGVPGKEGVRGVLWKQVGYRWSYPAAAVARPCGGADECEVGVDGAGVYGTGADYPKKLGRWIRPIQLKDHTPGTEVRGVPYSYGNQQRVYEDRSAVSEKHPEYDFGRQFKADYGPTPLARPRPVGHIRQGLGLEGRESTYPLGVDCAALVARIFGVTWLATSEILDPKSLDVGEGRTFKLPHGPDRGCPEPVRYISEIQPGDLLIKHGHVVIYSDMARIGGEGGSSRGIRVFEASSRCGSVCESVYDPSFFDGWWILRFKMSEGDDADCPRWLKAAAAAASSRH